MPETVQWEYRVKTIGGTFKRIADEEVEAMLNEWGLEGWEVVDTRAIEGSYKVCITAKRPSTGATRRQRSYPI
jgi:hypothetical protein